MDVRMEMLSSGGEFPMGAAPVGLSLVEGPGSIREGKIRGSAKSDMILKKKSALMQLFQKLIILI